MYVKIIFALTIACALLFGKIAYTQRSELRSRMHALEKSQQQAADLQKELAAIKQKGDSQNAKVIELATANPQIHDFLASDLPASGCMLDGTCNAVRSAAAALRPSASRAK